MCVTITPISLYSNQNNAAGASTPSSGTRPEIRDTPAHTRTWRYSTEGTGRRSMPHT